MIIMIALIYKVFINSLDIEPLNVMQLSVQLSETRARCFWLWEPRGIFSTYMLQL